MHKFLLLIFPFLFFACNESPKQMSKENPPQKPKKVALSDSLQQKEELIYTPTFSLDYIMGKFDPTTHPDFVELETIHASSKKMYLRKDAYTAFKKMFEAAKKEGVSLQIRSATRPFHHQKRIWEAKWTGTRLVQGKSLAKTIADPKERALKILEYSSMPGTSRHHWGTDMDFNAFENAYFEKGKGLKEYNWLVANAPSFGFCQPYTPKGNERPYGYNEEKWHWSYQPTAKKLTRDAKELLKDKNISGFKGAETATIINVVDKYVLGIDKSCL